MVLGITNDKRRIVLIHIEGFVAVDSDDNIFLTNTKEKRWNGEDLAETIDIKLSSNQVSNYENKDEYTCTVNTNIPNVNFRFYVSNEKCTLEEAEEGF